MEWRNHRRLSRCLSNSLTLHQSKKRVEQYSSKLFSARGNPRMLRFGPLELLILFGVLILLSAVMIAARAGNGGGMRYCNNCQQLVAPLKHFNWAVFLLGFLTLGIISFLYLIWYLIKGGTCPVCNSHNWGVPPSPAERERRTNPLANVQNVVVTPTGPVSTPANSTRFCSFCGQALVQGSRFCASCGKALTPS